MESFFRIVRGRPESFVHGGQEGEVIRDDERQRAEGRPHQEADERLHGVVEGAEEEDGAGEPQDAQLGDLEEVGGGVEGADRGREEAVHRRSQEVKVCSRTQPSPFWVSG